jgi:hypothetical protein
MMKTKMSWVITTISRHLATLLVYQTLSPMRTITTHTSKSVRFTPYAQMVCQLLNNYKRANPTATFAQMTMWYNRNHSYLSETSIARYYYGIHGYNNGRSYSQVRVGARVAI